MGDGDEEALEGDEVGRGIFGEEEIDVGGGDAVVLGRFGHLNNREERMTLAGVFADNCEGEVRAASAEAGEVFDPVFRLTRDDVQAGLRERLTVGERGVRRLVAEECGAEKARRISVAPTATTKPSALRINFAGGLRLPMVMSLLPSSFLCRVRSPLR